MPRAKNVVGESASTSGSKRKAGGLAEYVGRVSLTEEAQALYDKLSKNGTNFSVTRFLHEPTLDRLGLKTVAEALLQKVGLERFLHIKVKTYRGYTLEFMATVELIKPDEVEANDESEEEPKIRFRLNRRWRELTYSELREIFGISKAPDGAYEPLSTNRSSLFWNAITNRGTKDKNDKNTLITHPVLRLIHRFINMLFLNQGGPTNVNVQSLGLLRAMLPEGEGVPDWVDLFVQSCITKQGKASPGLIANGGIVTLLCRHFKINLKEQSHVPGHHLYDIEGLVELHMLLPYETDPNLFIWLWGHNNSAYLTLPRPLASPLPQGERARDFFVHPDREFVSGLAQATPPRASQGGTRVQEEDVPILDIGSSSQSQPPSTFQFDQTWEGFPSRMDAFVSQVTPWIAGMDEWRAQQDQRWVAMSVWQEQQNQHWRDMHSWQAEQSQQLSNIYQWHQYHDEDMEEARAHYTLDHDIIASLSNFSLGEMGSRSNQEEFTTRLGAFEHQREEMRGRRERRRRRRRRRRGRSTQDEGGASGSGC